MRLSLAAATRWALWTLAVLILFTAATWLAWMPITRAAVTAALTSAGAGDIKLQVTSASLWRVQLDDVAFKLKSQPFAAKQVTLARDHWWQTKLSDVNVSGANVPVKLDAPANESLFNGQVSGGAATTLPVEKISIDGQLVVRLGEMPGQSVAVKFEARQAANNTWAGSVHASAPGLEVRAEAQYGVADKRLAFQSANVALDLAQWQDDMQKIFPLPGGTWTLAGKVTGSIEGSYADSKLTASGRVQLREGKFALAAKQIAIEGVEAEWEFTDFNQLQSKPGTVRARSIKSGELTATSVDLELAFQGVEHVALSRARWQAFGGQLSLEPFVLPLDRQEFDAVVLAEGLDVKTLLTLAKDVPAQATGRVDGRLPIRIDRSGLRLGTGWLELTKGVPAELRFRAEGLLTGGMSPASTGYAVLKKVETGLLQLNVGEMRLDIRPPNAPADRSATLHLTGQPLDPEVKAPVTLDLNVNGPIEQLINFGLDKRVNFGAGK